MDSTLELKQPTFIHIYIYINIHIYDSIIRWSGYCIASNMIAVFWYVHIFLLCMLLRNKIVYAQVPAYVVKVKSTKSPYPMPSSPTSVSSATITEGDADYSFSSDGVLMTAANGKKFRCYMESGVKEVTMNDLVNDINKKKKKKMKTIKKKVKKTVTKTKKVPSSSTSVSSTLKLEDLSVDFYKSLLDENCKTLRTGYWTYEVCPFASAKQYHTPIGKKPHPDKKMPQGDVTQQEGVTVYILGFYKEEKDEIINNVYTQYFQDGTGKRQSIVSYKCNKQDDDDDDNNNNNNNNNNNDNNNNNYILNQEVAVEEPTPLHYHFTFRTAAVCKSNIDLEHARLHSEPVMEEIEYEEEIEVEEEIQVEVDDDEEDDDGDTSNAGLSKRGINVLKPLSGVCLRYVESWWTYELCGGGKIRQFHVEKSGNENDQEDTITTEFTLGQFDKKKNKKMVMDGTALIKSHPYFKLKQYYGKGTSCDLTNEPRSVFVEYECSNSQHTYIMGITETSTCTYKMSVATPLLCKIKEFDYLKKKSTSYENIRCFPAEESLNEIG
jgi:hypothetical protein